MDQASKVEAILEYDRHIDKILKHAGELEDERPLEFSGLHADIVDLIWRHMGRPRRIEAGAKPYDQDPEAPRPGAPQPRPKGDEANGTAA